MELCAQCGKRGDTSTLKRCSRCKTVRYCSTACQSRHWPRHKDTCGESSVDGPQRPDEGNAASQDGATGTSAQDSPNVFASLFDGTFYRTSWEQARSRAEEAFPGHQVTNDLTGDLDLTETEAEVEELVLPEMDLMSFGLPFLAFPFMFMPPRMAQIHAVSRKVLVVRLVSLIFLPPDSAGWKVEDCNGHQLDVWFKMDSPAPYFRYQDLRAGNFLCIQQATISVLERQSIMYIVLKDASCVRVFKP